MSVILRQKTELIKRQFVAKFFSFLQRFDYAIKKRHLPSDKLQVNFIVASVFNKLGRVFANLMMSETYTVSIGELLLANALCPNSRMKRAVGLLNHLSLGHNDALLLKNTRCVHGISMNFAIGIVFLNKQFEVLSVIELQKNGIIFGPTNTKHVLEVNKHRLPEFLMQKGSKLELKQTTKREDFLRNFLF